MGITHSNNKGGRIARHTSYNGRIIGVLGIYDIMRRSRKLIIRNYATKSHDRCYALTNNNNNKINNIKNINKLGYPYKTKSVLIVKKN